MKLIGNFGAITMLIAPVTFAVHESPIDWSYSGKTGPDHWGSLDKSFAACLIGTTQSPIALTSDMPLNSLDLQLTKNDTTFVAADKESAIQFDATSSSKINFAGVEYSLLQFHVHAKSEHTLDGEHFPLEIHFVHQNAQKELLVIGVFVESGAGANSDARKMYQHLNSQEIPSTPLTLNVDQLLPDSREFFHYDGSLTTPPCKEGVKWLVMKTPVSASETEIGAFTKFFSNNYRPVQPLQGTMKKIP